MTNAIRYSVVDGEIVAIDARSGDVRWQGRPDDGLAISVLPVPSSTDAVVLLDYTSRRGAFQNVVRIGPDGTVRWRAQLPTSGPTDAYVEMDFDDVSLSALSWTGYRVAVDLSTGQITGQRFVK